MGLLLALVLSAYFAARFLPVTFAEAYYPSADRIAAQSFGMMTDRMPVDDFLRRYVPFVFLEFLALAVALGLALRGRAEETRMLVAGVVVLSVLPWFHYGYFNDLAMRASIPALFVLQWLLLEVLGSLKQCPVWGSAALVIFLIGAVYPANMLRLSAEEVWRRGRLVQIPPEPQVKNLFQQQLESHRFYYYIGQYTGSLDAWFFRHVARPARAVNKETFPGHP